MSFKILPASEIRDRLAKVLKKLEEDKEPIYITQYGKAKAVLLNVERYDSLIKLLEDLEDINDFRKAEGQSVRDFEKIVSELEGPSSVAGRSSH